MKHAAGFTLLEVLLATLLLASAIMVTAASIRGMERAQQRGASLLAESGQRGAVAHVLRARIAAAMPLPFDPDDPERVIFVGTAERMEFTTHLPPYPTVSGPMRQLIEVQSGDGGQRICIANGDRRAGIPRCTADEQTTLVEGVGQIGFRYRGRDNQGHPGPWEPVWEQRERLPEWVEVRLQAPAGERAWPVMHIHVPLAAGVPR